MEPERENILTGNLRTLLFKFSLPSVIGMLISALYNFTDTIFVGNGVGHLGIAALTIVLPMQIIMLAIGLMVGAGASSIISRALGKGDRELAKKAGGNAFLLNLTINIIFMVLTFFFIDEILLFFGASSEVLPYGRDYLSIILFGFVFFSFSLSSNYIIRAEGRPRAAMYPMIIGAVLNIILDPIFIFVLKMGVRGVAIATIISQFVSSLFIILYFIYSKSIFKPKLRIFKPEKILIKNILSIGFPSFMMALMDSIIFILFNKALLYYGGDLYIAIVGISIRIIDLVVMPIIGIAHGFSTIASFNYGAGSFKRVKKVLGEAILWTSIIGAIGFIATMFFPEQLLGIFSNDAGLINKGIIPMRIIVIMFPTMGFLIVGGSLFQAIGKPIPALINTLFRQVIFLIPAIFLMPLFFGLHGVMMAWPVSDFLALIVTGIFILREFRILNKKLEEVKAI